MSVATELAGGLRLFSARKDAKTVEFTAAADLTAGTMMQLNSGLVGVVLRDVESGDTGVLLYEAEDIEVACAAASGSDYTVGSKVYFDVADAEVNETASGNWYCGSVNVLPAADAEKVRISLNGNLALAAGA